MELFRANITALESKSALAEMKTDLTELQAKFARSTTENARLKDVARTLDAQVENLKLALSEANRERDETVARLIQAEENFDEQGQNPWKRKGKGREFHSQEDKREWRSTMPSQPPPTFRDQGDSSKVSFSNLSNPMELVGKFFGGSSPAENTSSSSRPNGKYDRDHLHRHDSERHSGKRYHDREQHHEDSKSSPHQAQRSPDANKSFEDDLQLARKLQLEEDAEREAAEAQEKANAVLHDAHMALKLQNEWDGEDQIMREERFRLLAMSEKTFDCPICMEKCLEDGLGKFEDCEHKFCRECIKDHIESCLDDRKFPVPCPLCMTDEKREDKDCGSETMENLGIAQDKYDIWLNFEMAKYSILLDCPKCRQSVLVDKDDHATVSILTCPVPDCGHMWCKKCYQPVESASESDHSCDGTKELDKLMQSEGWKKCPLLRIPKGCKTPTARTYGCNHMTCGAPGCNTHFCYVDGAFICRAQNSGVAKEAVDQHYRTCKLFDVPAE
ncbi:hypothetical protein FRB90_006627 [Tulasnella sp. 427]|nr:hypothetical protein FRB90_006627 [Tulasnella sp. 427]